MEEARDPRALAAAKIAARARRLAAIRRRVTLFAASVLCACCLVIGGQLAAGHDPALTDKATETQAKKTQAKTTQAQADTTQTEEQPSTAGSTDDGDTTST